MFLDEVAQNGVAECSTGSGVEACEGRQLVAFEPPLPAKVFYNPARVSLSPVPLLTLWQFFAPLLLVCCCCSSVCVLLVFLEEICEWYKKNKRERAQSARASRRAERERQERGETDAPLRPEPAPRPNPEQGPEIAEAAQRLAGTFAVSSTMGNFVYKFEVDDSDPCVLRVSGKPAGTPAFDAPERGTISTTSNGSRRVDWADDQGTAFHAVFNENATRLRGGAAAAGGERMDFSGMRG